MFRFAVLALFGALPSYGAEPTLTQVVLSSGGVGQFSFTADTSGHEPIALTVPLNQVDDLLKSLHVDDSAGGRSIVRLQGREPLAETFRTLPFGPTAFASPEALLGALVGETVRVAPEGLTGAILSVSRFDVPGTSPGSPALARHQLTVATSTGIASLVLEDTPSIEFTSDALRTQIGAALSAIAAQRVQDRRTLQLTLDEGASRTVRFGYVVPTPVWKASYRLSLPASGDTARLQGFAVVENLSGRDWHSVQVMLTSGQPVLYHQGLYQAVFTQRPEAPVEVPNRLTPSLDQGVIAPRPPPPSPAPAAAMDVFRSRGLAAAPAPMAVPPPPPPPAEVQQAVAQVEFRLAEPVTAASGESLMLPILDRLVPARQVALFRADSGDEHPLVALLLTNDGQGAIPPGLATLFGANDAFIGDARLPATQPGEQRLASFAADLPVRIDSDETEQSTVIAAAASRGVLRLQRREQSMTTYRVTTPADRGRTVLVEQPKRDGYDVVAPTTGVADTPTHHRITFDAPAGATTNLTVTEQHVAAEELVLADIEPDQLAALAREGRISPALRAAFEKAAALRADLDQRSDALADLKTRGDAIVNDQDRVRKNLAVVPSGDLQRRYLAQLQAQENDLAQIRSQTDAAQRAVTAASAALKDYLGALSL